MLLQQCLVLNFVQRHEAVGFCLERRFLNPADKGREASPIRCDPDRHRVNKQPHHVLNARNARRSARDDRAEHGILRTVVLLKQNAPDTLDYRAHRGLAGDRQPLQRRCSLLRQAAADGLLAVSACAFRLPYLRYGCGLLVAGKGALPVAECLLPVLLAKPGNVAAVWRCFAPRYRKALLLQLIILHEMLHNDADAPAVHNDMVMAPQPAVGRLSQPDNGQPHQRVADKVEAFCHIRRLEFLQLLLLLIRPERSPVLVMNLDRPLLQHNLPGLLDLVCHKQRAEYIMTRNHRIHALFHQLNVNPAGYVEFDLFKIGR
ncbi:hypothetical protein PATA110616_23185 [Paenibacillus tarimensis]